MSALTWQFLEKNQNDPEKIEEAIARLISEHNDDETAHLESGQSLQSHKASEIIDHLAKSIVEDKIGDGQISSRCITSEQIIAKDFRTKSDVGPDVDGVLFNSDGLQMWQSGVKKVDIPTSGNPTFRGDVFAEGLYFLKRFVYTAFESIDTWAKRDPNRVYNSLGGVCIDTGPVSGTVNGISSESVGFYAVDFGYGNPIFQCFAKSFSDSKQLAHFGIGVSNGGMDHGGFGFCFDDAKIRVFILNNYGTFCYQDISGYSPNVWHEYRASMVSPWQIKYYIDGNLVYTWDYWGGYFPSGISLYQFGMRIKTTEDANKSLMMQYLALISNR